MQQYLESMCEVNQMRIMRAEDDCFSRLVMAEMEAKNVVDEEVGLQPASADCTDTWQRLLTLVISRKMAKSRERRYDVSCSTPTMMPLSIRTAAKSIFSALLRISVTPMLTEGIEIDADSQAFLDRLQRPAGHCPLPFPLRSFQLFLCS